MKELHKIIKKGHPVFGLAGPPWLDFVMLQKETIRSMSSLCIEYKFQ
jgi:hypothetical protein